MNQHIELAADDTVHPLSKLYLHPINPRQNGDPEDTKAMAASIAINGLIQNLAGYEDPERPGEIGIVAGGRRLRGLQHLAKNGSGTLDSKAPDLAFIPVKVTSDPMVARAWAGAEAATQKPLHPADEIAAYAAMAQQGNTPDMISRAFAQTEAHVRKRLKLADLIPEALAALRANQISLDVARALTIAADPEAQLSVLTTARAGNWNAGRVRQALTPDTIRSDDRKVRYIGLTRYQAEGGTLSADLFEECSYLHDSALVDRIFNEKMQTDASQLRKSQGWAWVKTARETWLSGNDVAGLQQIYPTKNDLPDGDETRLEELEDKEAHFDISDTERDELSALRARAAGDYTDEDRETGGIFVIVDRAGKLVIEGAYRDAKRPETSEDDTGGRVSSAPVKPDLTEAGRLDLQAVKLLALQTAMVDKTELVLDLFAWQLERAAPTYASPFQITLTDQTIASSVEDGWQIDSRLTDGSNKTDFDYRKEVSQAESFKAFQDAGKKHRNAVLTRHLVRALSGPQGDHRLDLYQLLVEATGANVRKVWTPDGPTYFSRLKTDALDRIWAELLDLDADSDQLREFGAMKKGDKVKELEKLFTDAATREALGLSRAAAAAIDSWLPAELRQAN